MTKFEDEETVEFEEELPVESALVGNLLYEIEDKDTMCDGNIEWVGLHFFEHVLMVRYKQRLWCCPQKYYAEAIPRFRILNATFTNGRRGQWRWFLSLLALGIAMIIIGAIVEAAGAKGVLIAIGCIVLIMSPLPLFFNRKYRYVTIDVKGGGGRLFSSAKTHTFRFSKTKPDEAFIINYVFGPLRKDVTPLHALAHLHEVSLANPLTPALNTVVTPNDWSRFEEGLASSSVYVQQAPALHKAAETKKKAPVDTKNMATPLSPEPMTAVDV